jgi:hypothetical protein
VLSSNWIKIICNNGTIIHTRAEWYVANGEKLYVLTMAQFYIIGAQWYVATGTKWYVITAAQLHIIGAKWYVVTDAKWYVKLAQLYMIEAQ